MLQNNIPFMPNGSYFNSHVFTDFDIELTANYNGQQTNTLQYTNNECANWDDISLNGNRLVSNGDSGNPTGQTINLFVPEGSYQNAEGFDDATVKLSGFNYSDYAPANSSIAFTLKQAAEMTDIAVNGSTLVLVFNQIAIGTVWQLSGFFNGIARFKENGVLEFPDENDPALQGTMKWKGDMGLVTISGSLNGDSSTHFEITITPWQKTGTLTYNSEGKQLNGNLTIKDATNEWLIVGQNYQGGIIASINPPDANGKVTGLIVAPNDQIQNVGAGHLFLQYLSAKYSTGGFTDWRIPTKDDFEVLYANKALFNFDINNNPEYFINEGYANSSDDIDGNPNWVPIKFNLLNGSDQSCQTDYPLCLRLVRNF